MTTRVYPGAYTNGFQAQNTAYSTFPAEVHQMAVLPDLYHEHYSPDGKGSLASLDTLSRVLVQVLTTTLKR